MPPRTLLGRLALQWSRNNERFVGIGRIQLYFWMSCDNHDLPHLFFCDIPVILVFFVGRPDMPRGSEFHIANRKKLLAQLVCLSEAEKIFRYERISNSRRRERKSPEEGEWWHFWSENIWFVMRVEDVSTKSSTLGLTRRRSAEPASR